MTRDGLSQSIPPAYTEFLGKQLIERVRSAMTTTEPEFLLPSQTSAPNKRSRKNTPDDPGWIAGVEFDQYDRYMLPIPGGDPNELEPWTRVTTLTGMVTNSEGLRIWSERNIVRGIGLRSDLRALLAASPDDKAVQDQVIATAKIIAGDGEAASEGTARHRILEDWSNDPTDPRVVELLAGDESFSIDMRAAVGKLGAEGIRVRHVERLVVNEHLRYAGRTDAFWEVTLPDGRIVLRIGDLKSGRDITRPEKRHPFGAQLAMYANATHIYLPETRSFVPMPSNLDREAGYVLGVRGGVAELHEVDLLAGWQAAKVAVLLHRQRKASVTFLPVGVPFAVEAPALTDLRAQVTAPSITSGEPCPGDPTHYATAHGPGGAWFGVPLDHVQRHPSVAARFVAPATGTYLATPEGLTPLPGQGGPVPDPTTLAKVASRALQQEFADRDPELSPSGRRKRTCSNCRRPGHTAKRCPGKDAPAPAPDADPQDNAQPVDSEPAAPAVTICPHASGWTSRVSDGAWVCVDCGRPSEATVSAMRTGAPLPTSATQQPAVAPAAENGATVARLDPAPTGAPVAPWAVPAPSAPPTLLDRIGAVRSMEELGALWTADQGTPEAPGPREWGPEHTEAANRAAASGLPAVVQ